MLEAFIYCAVSMVLTDNFIRKTKQRYNSPRSLSTKINLADMQTEIKLRPPYQLSAEDIGSINGFSQHKQSKYKGIGREHTVNTTCILAFSSQEAEHFERPWAHMYSEQPEFCTAGFFLQIFKSSYSDTDFVLDLFLQLLIKCWRSSPCRVSSPAS